MIEVDALAVRRASQTICRLDELRVADGERWIVEGPNGSGKSTLLRVLAGIETTFEGRVHIAASRRERVFIHQSPYLFRGGVRENLAFGLRARGLGRRAREERLERWIEVFDLAPLLDRRIGGLSGGECRRVALARALVLEPHLLLLDEPFADLDAARTAALRGLLEELRATVLVTSPRPLAEAAGWKRVALGSS